MHWKSGMGVVYYFYLMEKLSGFRFINQTLKQVKHTQNWNLPYYHGILQEGGVTHAEDMEKFMNG